MPTLPAEIIAIIACFAPLFTRPSWEHAQVLLTGAILCRGPRRVSSILRVMGLAHEKRFEKYHRFLNRACWNSMAASRILLGLLIMLLPISFPILIAVDDTIERRKGKKIKAKGCYRDACRSSQKMVVKCFGLKWLCLAIIIPLPWSKRPWALPFMTLLAPSKKANEAAGKKHRTIIDWTEIAIRVISRWLKRPWVLLGDGGFSCVHLAWSCIRNNVTLVSRLRLDACLYEYPEQSSLKKRGRKREKGNRAPSLKELAKDSSQPWIDLIVQWYGGETKQARILSGNHLWYTPGEKPIPISWVIVVDPKNPDKPEAFFSTDLQLLPEKIINWFVLRWNIEVTFEEVRAFLGVETQRQWTDKSIARSTPLLMGLYSLVTLIGYELQKYKPLPILSTAWYKKENTATFSDVLAFVRGRILGKKYFNDSGKQDNIIKIPLIEWNILMNQLDLVA